MNFYVGLEVVAIKNHSRGRFKKGQEFVIQGIKKEPCCGLVTVDVGIYSDKKLSICRCGKISKNDCYYGADYFTPKQQLSETTYNEVMMCIEQGKELAILN